MKKLLFLSAFIAFSLAAFSQNDSATVKFSDFLKWARAVNLPGYSFSDFDYDGRGLMANYTKTAGVGVVSLRIDEVSHFYDFKHTLTFKDAKVYDFKGYPTVYYGDGQSSFLGIKMLSGKVFGEVAIDRIATQTELEQIATLSGILNFPAKANEKTIVWPVELTTDVRLNADVQSIVKDVSHVQGFTTEYEVAVLMDRKLMSELERIFKNSAGNIESITYGNITLICTSGISIAMLREHFFPGDLIRFVYYIK